MVGMRKSLSPSERPWKKWNKPRVAHDSIRENTIDTTVNTWRPTSILNRLR